MKKENWVNKKFRFDLNFEHFGSILIELQDTPAQITNLASSLSLENLIKRNNDKWSIQENIGHLIDLEELHDGRIDDFIEGKKELRAADMSNKKTEEADHNTKKISELLEQLKVLREHFVKRLKHLDEKVLSHSAIHPRLNQPMKPIDMAQFILEHDKHHIQTIKELIDKLSL